MMRAVYLFKGPSASNDAQEQIMASPDADAIIIRKEVREPKIHREYHILFLKKQQPSFMLSIAEALNRIKGLQSVNKEYLSPASGAGRMLEYCRAMLIYGHSQTVHSDEQIIDWIMTVVDNLS